MAGNKISEEDKELMVEALQTSEELLKRSGMGCNLDREPNYRLIRVQIAIALFEKSTTSF